MRAARDPLDATAARQAEGLPLRGVLPPPADEPPPTRIVPAHRLLDLRPPSHLAQESEEDMAEVVERRGPPDVPAAPDLELRVARLERGGEAGLQDERERGRGSGGGREPPAMDFLWAGGGSIRGRPCTLQSGGAHTPPR